MNKFYRHIFVLSALIIAFEPLGQAAFFPNPKVSVYISLNKQGFITSDSIWVTIKLTNNSKKSQKLLFDKPQIPTGGLWDTTAELIDLKTNKSVLEIKNKALLSSTIFLEDQLKDKYVYLSMGSSISHTYKLSDIAVINWTGVPLPKGTYELQLFYVGNSSNKVRFYII